MAKLKEKVCDSLAEAEAYMAKYKHRKFRKMELSCIGNRIVIILRWVK